MTNQFTFNTQRQYSPEGQIIKVIYNNDNTAHFMDTTRGLTNMNGYLKKILKRNGRFKS